MKQILLLTFCCQFMFQLGFSQNIEARQGPEIIKTRNTGDSVMINRAVNNLCDDLNLNPVIITSCGDSTGLIDLQIQGSNLDFNFLWSNGSTDSIQQNLTAGEYSVTIENDGCLTYETFTINYNRHLVPEWERTFGGPGVDRPNNMLILEDESIIVIGNAIHAGGEVSSDTGTWMVKVDSDGVLLWEQSVGSSAARFVTEMPSGELVLGSRINHDVELSKTDDLGNEIWTKQYLNFLEITALASSINNEIYLGGFMVEPTIGTPQGSYDAWLMKLDANGDSLWMHRFGGSSFESLRKIHTLPNGDLLTITTTSSVDGDLPGSIGDQDIWIRKYNSEGEVIMEQVYGGYLTDEIFGSEILDNGNLLLLAYSYTENGWNLDFDFDYNDIIALEIDPMGEIVDAKNLGKVNGQMPHSYTFLQDGSLLMVYKNYDELIVNYYDSSYNFIETFNFLNETQYMANNWVFLEQSPDNSFYLVSSKIVPEFFNRTTEYYIGRFSSFTPYSEMIPLKDTVLCAGATLDISINPGNYFSSWEWEDGSNDLNRSFTFDSDSVISIHTLTTDGCVGSDYLEVNVNEIEATFVVADANCGHDNGAILVDPYSDVESLFTIIHDQNEVQDSILNNLEEGLVSFSLSSDYCEKNYELTIETRAGILLDTSNAYQTTNFSFIFDLLVTPDSSIFLIEQKNIYEVFPDGLTSDLVLSNPVGNFRKAISLSEGINGLLNSSSTLSFYDKQWNLLDQQTFGAPGIDLLNDMSKSEDGHYFFSGTIGATSITTNFGFWDGWLIKLDQSMQTIWSKNFGGSLFDQVFKTIPLEDGGALLFGISNSSDFDLEQEGYGSDDIWISRVDTDGNLLWSRTYGGSGDEAFVNADFKDNTIYIAANTTSYDFDVANQGFGNYRDGWLFALDLNGDFIWNKRITNEKTHDRFKDLKLHNNHLYAIYLNVETDSTNFIHCYDLQGDLVSQRFTPHPIELILAINDSELLVTGSQFRWNGVYWVQINDLYKFKSVDIPSIIELPSDTSLCVGDSLFIEVPFVDGLEYEWSDNQFGHSRVFTEGGFFELKVSSIPECSVSDDILIDFCLSPTPPGDTTLCGDAFFNARIPGMNYQWSTGDTSYTIQAQNTGWAVVTITNYSGTTTIDSTWVNYIPDVLDISTVQNDESCFEAANGSIELNVVGGTAPYEFNWNDGASLEDRFNLSDGTYAVTISDDNGCQSIQSFTIDAYPGIFNISNLEDETCAHLNNGRINALLVGSYPPFEYLWSNGSTNPSLTNLNEGIYTLSLTDANDCVFEYDFEIAQPDSLIADIITVAPDPSMDNGSIELVLSGGVPPYSINWILPNDGTGTSVTDLGPGEYWVQVFDALACVQSYNITLDILDGVNDLSKESDIYLAPNPTEDKVNIAFEGAVPNIMEIYNPLGQLLISKPILAGSHSTAISLAAFPAGTYYLVFEYERDRRIKKIIKL